MKVTDMLARNAELYPDESAIVELRPDSDIRRELTWKQFDENANRIANALVAQGIKKDDKIIIWMMNSVYWLEVYFGVLRSGAWAVPLNFRFTSADLVYCADIAEAKVMFLGGEFIERVQDVRLKLTSIESFVCIGEETPDDMKSLDHFTEEISSANPEIEISDEDACGLYFTSGTTGSPKPILLTHNNLPSFHDTGRNWLSSHVEQTPAAEVVVFPF